MNPDVKSADLRNLDKLEAKMDLKKKAEELASSMLPSEEHPDSLVWKLETALRQVRREAFTEAAEIVEEEVLANSFLRAVNQNDEQFEGIMASCVAKSFTRKLRQKAKELEE